MTYNNNNNFTKDLTTITNFCKRKGFVYPSGLIYGGLSGFFDYGNLGTELKNNIKTKWWNFIVLERNYIVGIDGSIITNPKVWKASGHIDNFSDLILTCKKCKSKLRADHYIEEKLKINVEGYTPEEINKIIKEHNLKCPKCSSEFEEVKDFNLMFKVNIGPEIKKENTAYLRPETAQNIFSNFKFVQENNRMKLPFGIAQIGKAFRNEISARDFLFRMREFEQMELEFFTNPNNKRCPYLTDEILQTKFQFLDAKTQENESNEMKEIIFKDLLERNIEEWHIYWLYEYFNWFRKELNFSYENLRIREHTKSELSHYSSATFDIDYKFPFGFKEILGCANRGNYDLKQHIELSKNNLYYYDEKESKNIIPKVIEPSLGLDRLFLTILFESYYYDNERKNIVLKIPKRLAPIKAAVLPLVNKKGLPEKSREITKILRTIPSFNIYEDYTGSIGRRYARQDEIGTPYSVTIDFQTLEDNSVTIRDRETTKQERINIENLKEFFIKEFFY